VDADYPNTGHMALRLGLQSGSVKMGLMNVLHQTSEKQTVPQKVFILNRCIFFIYVSLVLRDLEASDGSVSESSKRAVCFRHKLLLYTVY